MMRDGLLLLGLFLASLLMALIIWPYTSGRLDIDFLLTKQRFVQLFHYRWAFYLHIFSSLFVLIAGGTQFSPWILQHWRKVHRWMGRLYVGLILGVAAPAGLVLAFYGNGGWISQSSFVVLSLLWWVFTFWGLRSALKGQFKRHGDWMIRSFALTLSAISLRLYQFLLALLLPSLDPEITYLYLAWISWVGNWAVAEYLIYYGLSQRLLTGSKSKKLSIHSTTS